MRTDELRPGDVIFYPLLDPATAPEGLQYFACLGYLVAALTGLPHAHCAIVVEAGNPPVVAESTSTKGQIRREFSPEGSGYVVKRPASPEVAAAAASAAQHHTPDGAASNGDYAFDRLLLVAVLAGAGFARFDNDEQRRDLLVKGELAIGALSALLDALNEPARAMCSEYVAMRLRDAGLPITQTARDASHPGVPELGDAYRTRCLGELTEAVMGLAQLISGESSVHDAVRSYFNGLTNRETAERLVEDVVSAGTDEGAADRMLERLFALIGRAHADGYLEKYDDEPTWFVSCRDLFDADALGAAEALETVEAAG